MTKPETNLSSTPEAIQELCKLFGNKLSEVYAEALQLTPELNLVKLMLHQDGPSFVHSPKGLTDSWVYLSSREDFYYTEVVKLNLDDSRSTQFRRFFSERNITLDTTEAAEIIMLHEMGHANDLAMCIREANGNPAEGHNLYASKQRRERDNLPLKMYPTYAEYVWNTNLEGYQDKLRAQGMTDEMWQQVFADNYLAYIAMPSEQLADSFVLRVLNRSY